MGKTDPQRAKKVDDFSATSIGREGDTRDLYALRIVQGVPVVTLTQSHLIDSNAIERLSLSMKEVLSQSGAPSLVIDLDRVKYLSSSALGMLFGLLRRSRQQAGAVALANISPDVMETFHITKLDTEFQVYATVEAAVAGILGESGDRA